MDKKRVEELVNETQNIFSNIKPLKRCFLKKIPLTNGVLMENQKVLEVYDSLVDKIFNDINKIKEMNINPKLLEDQVEFYAGKIIAGCDKGSYLLTCGITLLVTEEEYQKYINSDFYKKRHLF